ncbi:MAG: hypothetical protein RL122_2372 [Pseudomonadota bacterium]|jgi:hypothetical protein
MKNRYLLIPLALVLAGCVAPSPTPAASNPPLSQNGSTQPQAQVALQEIHLDTALPSAVGELVDWLFAFGATVNGGTGDRVFSYGSADSLRADTLKQLATMPDLKNPQRAADTMAQRATQAVDFSRNDLVVVNLMDGGPPFGEYRQTRVGANAVEFCIDPPANPSGISGMALRTTTKFYLAPKGVQVRQCAKR